MLVRSRMVFSWFAAAGACTAMCVTPADAARYADVLGYFEPGQNVDVVYGSDPLELYDNPQAALGGPGVEVPLSQGTLTQIVSLGGWTDDASSGTNGRTTGLVVGFSTEVLNGEGDDLLIVGNAPYDFVFYEPGFVEVAIESDGGGATADGWQDETFYLLKPGNYDLIADPRTSSNAIGITTNPDFSLNYASPFDDDKNLPGYFDITNGGDVFDLDDVIDAAGNAVSLESIAYVRLRSVSDSDFPFGSYFAPEVDYLEVIEQQGDLDGNRFVGLSDLDVVLASWNQTVPVGSLLNGELTHDGFVGLDDLDVVLANWNSNTSPTSSTAVPEPAVLTAMFPTLFVLISRRSK